MLVFFILRVFQLFYHAFKNKSIKTPPNKLVTTNKLRKKIKTPLNQKQLFFLAKIIYVTPEMCMWSHEISHFFQYICCIVKVEWQRRMSWILGIIHRILPSKSSSPNFPRVLISRQSTFQRTSADLCMHDDSVIYEGANSINKFLQKSGNIYIMMTIIICGFLFS